MKTSLTHAWILFAVASSVGIGTFPAYAQEAEDQARQPVCAGLAQSPEFQAKTEALRSRLSEAESLDRSDLALAGITVMGTVLALAPEFKKGAIFAKRIPAARPVGAGMMVGGLAGVGEVDHLRSRDGIPSFSDGAERFCAYAHAQARNGTSNEHAAEALSSDSFRKAISEAQAPAPSTPAVAATAQSAKP